MHEPTMKSLDFTRIQQEVASHAACQLGKDLALALEPLQTLTLTKRAQQETTEAKAVLGGGRSVPFGGIQDVRLPVERGLNGGVLRPEQLAAVADTIYGCRQLHQFLVQHQTSAPLIGRHSEAFGRFDLLEEEIRRCIERGGVSSRASRELKQIRTEIAVIEGRIQDRLNSVLKQVRQHLQDALVTQRNGRYVVPVKASARASVPGVVHGASASGSTVFVEPEAVRQLSEELDYWRAMEEAEVEQVLATLSGLVAAHADGLQATLGAVAELDLIFAKARLSFVWEAEPVEWNESGLIDLKGARHPFLGRAAIGNQICMTPQTRVLIVTGPNTGGKTLLLKTLGLLVLIARSGLHIPAEAGSTLCFFTNVLADIGDSQSLEHSLSTFSGHIANVAPMLSHAGPQTLILLDELGSGTDPHEGTGLGIALVEAFLQQGAYTLVTTHLRDIKEYGRMTPGCAIAGMGFDGETLRPTYRLLYGTLGESHGIEIAARAGLPRHIVDRARQLVYGDAGAPVEVAPTFSAIDVPLPVPRPLVLPAEPEPARVEVRPVQTAHSDLALVVAPVSASRCRVWQAGGEREMPVRDTLRRHYRTGLAVGDRVRVRDGQITEVAKRETVLVSRDADTLAETVVAANLDQMLVVMSTRHPDFHPTALTRHLFYAERRGVTPVVCLTKSDLVSAAVEEEYLQPFQALGYTAVAVSSTRLKGIDDLRSHLAGRTTAVMGVPGAGKSTLLGALGAPDRGQQSQPQPLRLDEETWLIDMPGLRELGVWKPDLSVGFREFSPYVGACTHAGCLHRQEKGCAVRLAADLGQIERRRYEQYLQLLRQMRLA